MHQPHQRILDPMILHTKPDKLWAVYRYAPHFQNNEDKAGHAKTIPT